MAVQLTNNAQTTLAAAITTVQTNIQLAVGTGSAFPAPVAPNFAYCTLANAAGNIEIVKVTARAGDTLTVVRGQEGTAPFAFALGDKCENRITAATLANKLDVDTGGTLEGKLTLAAGSNAGSSICIPAGAAPSAPLSGDVWNVAGSPKWYDGATTQTLAFVGSTVVAATNLAPGSAIEMTGDVSFTSGAFVGGISTAAATLTAGAAVRNLGFTPAHAGANTDITSLGGLTTLLTAAQGGTGVASLAALLTALGFSMSANSVNIFGFIFQWGTFAIGAAGGANVVVSFAPNFPNNAYGIIPIVSGSATQMIGFTGLTTAGATINKGASDTSARPGIWIAWGD
jgi:hypothetical protein